MSNLNVLNELEDNYKQLKTLSEKLKQKIEKLMDQSESKAFRQLLMEKELTQLLSGYSSIERLKLDTLKTIRDLSKETEDTNDTQQILLEIMQKLEKQPSTT